jgi:hypothetical protein
MAMEFIMLRLFSVITDLKNEPRVKHYSGLPPELASGKDYSDRLPAATVLIVEEPSDGVFLYRYASDGSFGGDTWHRNIEEAKAQAKFEFDDAVTEWKAIPEEVEDALDFALSQIKATN